MIKGLLAGLAEHPLVVEMSKEYDRRKAFVRLVKSNPCLDCGVQYHIACMTFDHRDWREKKGNIRDFVMLHKFEDLVAELEKCDLVCRNCHDIREYGRGTIWNAVGRVRVYTGQWPKHWSVWRKCRASAMQWLNRLFASRRMQRQILEALGRFDD